MALPSTSTQFGQRSIGQAGQRFFAAIAPRLWRVRANALHTVQAGTAAGIAWYVAHNVLGHRTPFFAPISAVIVLAVAAGQRLRRAIELVLGVALGILIGDALFYVIGTGPWQVGVGVILAVTTAIFLGGSALVISQTGSSAVLVATLAPPTHGVYYTRVVDALVGGVAGVLVMALLLPVNPLTLVKRAAGPSFRLLAVALRDCATALESRDFDAVQAALEELHGSAAAFGHFKNTLVTAREAATLSPARWHVRAPLAQYVECAVHLEQAERNARVLVRRVLALLREQEPVPDVLPATLRTLADAIGELSQELAEGREPLRARGLCLAAAARAGDAYRAGLGFSGAVVVAQARSTAIDLMRATGVGDRPAQRAVRRAAGRLPQPERWPR